MEFHHKKHKNRRKEWALTLCDFLCLLWLILLIHHAAGIAGITESVISSALQFRFIQP
jgi:hypothetical protein